MTRPRVVDVPVEWLPFETDEATGRLVRRQRKRPPLMASMAEMAIERQCRRAEAEEGES